MQREKLFLVLSVMALATGCSNDETIKVNGGDRIDFSVTAGKLTRATATTTSSINEFKVWAFTANTMYIDGITVAKNGSQWTYSGTKFWPETPVDFFAVSPVALQSGTVVTVNTTDRKIENYVASGREDLLYAMNKGEMKENYKNTSVPINFRHALSQIVFKVKNTNSSIKVEVKSIKVDGVANTSTFTWATETTGSNLTEENGDTETEATWGEWDTPIGEVEYTAVDLGNAYTVTSEAQFLTSDEGNGALFLMPQTLKPWLTIDADKMVKVTGKARLLVNCKITDVTSEIELWPNNGEDYGEVAISLNNPNNDPHKGNGNTHECWMQGKKYIYTLIFGEGGGYNPEPDDPNKPEPVLVPITFTVSVDDFQNGGEYELNANNP